MEFLRISRRNLPHWELGGSTYFVTYRCVEKFILDYQARSLVLDNWLHWDNSRYLLHTIVVMPNHVHLLMTPLCVEPGKWIKLETIFHTNKSYSAHAINRLLVRCGPVWQDERYDRIVRNDHEFYEKWRYIAENPMRAGLIVESEPYPWLYQNARGMELSPAPASGRSH